jgi:putative SOS response-associated peptidase YedK
MQSDLAHRPRFAGNCHRRGLTTVNLYLLRPFDADKMTASKVGKEVGNAKNDRPELMEPVKDEQTKDEQTDEQTDNPSLF